MYCVCLCCVRLDFVAFVRALIISRQQQQHCNDRKRWYCGGRIFFEKRVELISCTTFEWAISPFELETRPNQRETINNIITTIKISEYFCFRKAAGLISISCFRPRGCELNVALMRRFLTIKRRDLFLSIFNEFLVFPFHVIFHFQEHMSFSLRTNTLNPINRESSFKLRIEFVSYVAVWCYLLARTKTFWIHNRHENQANWIQYSFVFVWWIKLS